MKNYTITLLLIVLTSLSGFTQQVTEETITIKKSDLTGEQLQKIQHETLMEKMETYGEWVGVGNEVGVAVREALLGVVDVADKFGGTDVGKFTLVMVAWKVMGKDLIRIIIGLLFIFLYLLFLNRFYRDKFKITKIMTKGSKWKFWEEKEYTTIEPDSEGDTFELMRFIYLISIPAAFGLTYALMFG
jgi:hypothetical protein